jgi:hypothetical protein
VGVSTSTPKTDDNSRALPEDLRVLLQFAEDVALSWAGRNGWMIQPDEAKSIACTTAGELAVVWDESRVARDWRPIVTTRVCQRMIDEMRLIGGRNNRRKPMLSLEEYEVDQLSVLDDDYTFAHEYLDSLRNTGERRERWLQIILLRIDGCEVADIGAVYGVTGSRISKILGHIRVDYLCWADVQACGMWRVCPRCREVHRQMIITRRRLAAPAVAARRRVYEMERRNARAR